MYTYIHPSYHTPSLNHQPTPHTLTTGRSSARETIGRVAAAAIAKKVLQLYSGVEIIGYVKKVRYSRGGRERESVPWVCPTPALFLHQSRLTCTTHKTHNKHHKKPIKQVQEIEASVDTESVTADQVWRMYSSRAHA